MAFLERLFFEREFFDDGMVKWSWSVPGPALSSFESGIILDLFLELFFFLPLLVFEGLIPTAGLSSSVSPGDVLFDFDFDFATKDRFNGPLNPSLDPVPDLPSVDA